MNVSHSDLTDWGLTHVLIEKGFTILDVGCGGGRTIKKMSSIATEGLLFGIDYSKGSVAASEATNKRLIESGRVEIREASVSKLPFPDNKFDLVTAWRPNTTGRIWSTICVRSYACLSQVGRSSLSWKATWVASTISCTGP